VLVLAGILLAQTARERSESTGAAPEVRVRAALDERA
jgi:hypothetical protein